MTVELKESRTLWEDYIGALTRGQKHRVFHLFDKLIDNRQIEDIHINVISKSMKVIGEQWSKGKVSIAEEHIASCLTREILDYFKFKTIPLATDDRPKIACMTVEGELHTLPLKIAVDMLEAKGWEVFNLENPLPLTDLIDFMDKNDIDKLGISISYTLSIEALNKTISEIRRLKNDITIIIGGSAADEKQISDYDRIITDMEKFDELIN